MKTVAKVAAFKGGKFLMGKRRDNGRWCCPGGHADEGETPHAAGVRELAEETGLEAPMLEHLATQDVKGGKVRVHAFKTDVEGEPFDQDPDAEFTEVRWVDPKAMPRDVMANLHSSPDVVLEAIGATGTPWASFSEGA